MPIDSSRRGHTSIESIVDHNIERMDQWQWIDVNQSIGVDEMAECLTDECRSDQLGEVGEMKGVVENQADVDGVSFITSTTMGQIIQLTELRRRR